MIALEDLLLLHIRSSAHGGIKFTELVEAVNGRPSDVSGALKRLKKAGKIHRFELDGAWLLNEWKSCPTCGGHGTVPADEPPVQE